MLHLNTLARGPAHHDAALPEQALCGLGFGEHHVAELNLSLAMDKPSVDNKYIHPDNDTSVIEHLDMDYLSRSKLLLVPLQPSLVVLRENDEYVIKSNYIYFICILNLYEEVASLTVGEESCA